jgi:hypothetical protein
MQTQAGEVSQRLFCPETLLPHHAAFDQAHVTRLIGAWDRHASRHEQEEKVADLFSYTKELLAEPRCTAAIHAVAQALMREKKIPGDRVRTLIRDAMRNANLAASNLPEQIACPHCAEYDEIERQ